MADAPVPEVQLAVVGTSDVVANSLSPRMMSAALDALDIRGRYGTLALEAPDAQTQLRCWLASGAYGCNVTMPFKRLAAQIADTSSERVRRSGVANTLRVAADGAIHAEATDGVALRDALAARSIALDRRRVLIIGAGGAAAEAAITCIEGGVRQLVFANRTRRTADALAARLHRSAPALDLQVFDHVPIRDAIHLVISCVPADALASDMLEAIEGDPSFVDFAYRRGGGATPMMVAAESRGAECIDGRELLVRQAAAALRVWFDVEPPIEVMTRAVR